jgi:hypothetical protein
MEQHLLSPLRFPWRLFLVVTLLHPLVGFCVFAAGVHRQSPDWSRGVEEAFVSAFWLAGSVVAPVFRYIRDGASESMSSFVLGGIVEEILSALLWATVIASVVFVTKRLTRRCS